MISHKSIATLGIGFGTLAVASIGLLTPEPAMAVDDDGHVSVVASTPRRKGRVIAPHISPATPPAPRRRHLEDEDVLALFM